MIKDLEDIDLPAARSPRPKVWRPCNRWGGAMRTEWMVSAAVCNRQLPELEYLRTYRFVA